MKRSRIVSKLRKLTWHLHRPEWACHHGIWLPVKHPLISPGIARELYLGSYETKELEIIDKRLAANDTFFEVGSGLGFLSAYSANKISANRVFTYEANTALIPLVHATHARNRVAPTVTNAMLGKGEGEREFHLADEFWASSAHRPSGRVITVRQIDFNTELARIKPSFLMVDIEGGEAELLAEADLTSLSKICIETHRDVLGDEMLSEMFANLVSRGFALDFSLIRKNVFYFSRTR